MSWVGFLAGCTLTGTGTPPLSDAASPLVAEAAANPEKTRPAETAIASKPEQPHPVSLYSIDKSGMRILTAPDASNAGAEKGKNETADITLSFKDTRVADAAALIFGEIHPAPFTVDADADVPLTFSTHAPITRAAALPLFSAVLKSQGLVLSEDNGLFRISRQEKLGAREVTRAAGWGLAAYPLKNLAAEDARRLLSLALPEDSMVPLASPPLLLVSGTESDLKLVAESLAAIDLAPLSGMQAALIGLQNVTASAMATQLQGIFGIDENEAGKAALRVVPVPDRNLIVVLARSAGLRDQAVDWIKRLDQPFADSAPIYYLYRLQHRKAAEVQASLNDLLTRKKGEDESPVKLALDATRNALLIEAPPARWQVLRDMLQQLDAEPLQVLIEATILEVALNDTLRYGVQYAVETGSLLGITDSRLILTAAETANPLAATLPGFAFAAGASGAPEAIIESLARKTNVRVVSSPKLMVIDQAPARLQIGDSVPVTTQTSASTETANTAIVNSIQYRDTGVTLDVTPRVSNTGTVTLDVTQDVSDVTRTTSSSINSPTISQRRLTTSVAIPSGTTMVLGGMIRERKSSGSEGIPLLKDLPVLGGLFGTQDESQGRTELLALLTPHIVETPQKGVSLTDALQARFTLLAERQP